MDEISKIELNEAGLKTLTQNILKGLVEDLEEAQINIENYKTKMEQSTGFDVYGSLFNDSLKIKGSVRDKLIKVASMIKDKASTSNASNIQQFDNKFISSLADQVLAEHDKQKKQ